MAIHPDAQALLDRYESLGAKPLRDLGVIRARAAVASSVEFAGPKEKVDSIVDDVIEAHDRAIPIRRYRSSPEPKATILYLHGGGWVAGDVATADPACRALANASNCEVVSVEYRRSPETRYPGPLEDAACVLRTITTSSKGPLFVAGDSAGGGLAASLAFIARDESIALAGQILLYPAIDPQTSFGDPDDGQTSGLSRGDMAFFWNNYLGHALQGQGYAAPLHIEDVSGLAPALIISAEIDILRDENERYVVKLGDAGCSVIQVIAAGMIHGFFWQFGAVPTARRCLASISEFIDARLS
jgi:acetyl esterase